MLIEGVEGGGEGGREGGDKRERIGPVSHLIVIASVFGLETVDRNQQRAWW